LVKKSSDKRGAELSLNVIIIAAIALIVLVILVLIFTGRIAVFRVGVEDCGSKGGTCIAAKEDCRVKLKSDNYVSLPGASCFTAGQKDANNPKCCIPT